MASKIASLCLFASKVYFQNSTAESIMSPNAMKNSDITAKSYRSLSSSNSTRCSNTRPKKAMKSSIKPKMRRLL